MIHPKVQALPQSRDSLGAVSALVDIPGPLADHSDIAIR
jgi:hypothetical protein